VEVAAPKVEVAPPRVEVAAPAVEVAPPRVEVAAPVVEVAPPRVEVAAPVVEVAPPRAEVPAPVVEVAPPRVEVAAPVVEVAPPPEFRLPKVEIFGPEEVAVSAAELPPVADEAGLPSGFPGKLPGADEAARIAAEMAALKPTTRRPVEAPTPAISNDLTLIKGIGPVYAERLRVADIRTFAALAEAPDALLEEVTRGNLERVTRDDWRGQARQMSA
jgi:predicted flap endonuclease-1-like 5' DNA nuclease